MVVIFPSLLHGDCAEGHLLPPAPCTALTHPRGSALLFAFLPSASSAAPQRAGFDSHILSPPPPPGALPQYCSILYTTAARERLGGLLGPRSWCLSLPLPALFVSSHPCISVSVLSHVDTSVFTPCVCLFLCASHTRVYERPWPLPFFISLHSSHHQV